MGAIWHSLLCVSTVFLPISSLFAVHCSMRRHDLGALGWCPHTHGGHKKPPILPYNPRHRIAHLDSPGTGPHTQTRSPHNPRTIPHTYPHTLTHTLTRTVQSTRDQAPPGWPDLGAAGPRRLVALPFRALTHRRHTHPDVGALRASALRASGRGSPPGGGATPPRKFRCAGQCAGPCVGQCAGDVRVSVPVGVPRYLCAIRNPHMHI